jgi:hypothetical protein
MRGCTVGEVMQKMKKLRESNNLSKLRKGKPKPSTAR